MSKFDFGVSRIFHVADFFMVTMKETCRDFEMGECRDVVLIRLFNFLLNFRRHKAYAEFKFWYGKSRLFKKKSVLGTLKIAKTVEFPGNFVNKALRALL